jgi:hypothetical protein
MNRRLRSVVLFGLSIALLSPAWAAEKAKIAKPEGLATQVKAPSTSVVMVAQPCNGPDLAASQPAIVKSASGRTGILSITATIKNQGLQDFVSGPNQAAGNITVHNPGFSGPAAYTQLANVPIVNLAKNASVSLSGRHEIVGFIEWGEREPRSGECKAQVNVIVRVNWDPDIRMDSNTQNDDCRAANDVCSARAANTVKYMVECPW